MLRWLMWGVWLLLLASSASATDYYVSPSGSGSTCSDGSPCSTATALAAATAGDTVHFKTGTYTGQMTPTNSGTPGNYLVLRAKAGDSVTLQNGLTSLATGSQGTFSLPNKSWIQIGPGFTFSVDTYGSQINGCVGGGCPWIGSYGHNVVVGNTFSPGNTSNVGDDGFMIRNIGAYATVKDNTISNAGEVYSIIYLDGPGHVVSNNTITHNEECAGGTCQGGIEVLNSDKQGAWIVNNVLNKTSTAWSGIGLWCDVTGNNTRFVNNIVLGRWGLGMKDEDFCIGNTWRYNIFHGMNGLWNVGTSGTGRAKEVFDHNTVYALTGLGYVVQNSANNVTITNNIFMPVQNPMCVGDNALGGTSDFDYNLYCLSSGTCNSSTSIAYHASDASSPSGSCAVNRTLTNWRSDTGDEANSAVGNPNFADAANNNFSVSTGSPAYQTGSGGTNMGACPGNSMPFPSHTGHNYACGSFGAAPSITFTATPTSIRRGQSTFLAWSAATATRCDPTWHPSTGSYGDTVFFPSTNTTYNLPCSNTQGSASQDQAVTVLPPLTTPAPIAWWKFESSGTDSSGNGLTCTTSGSPTFSSAQLGNGMVLNGTNQHCTVSNTALLSPSSALTIAAWVNYSTAHTGTMAILSKDDDAGSAGGQYSLGLQYDTTGAKRYARFEVVTSSIPARITNNTLLNASTWVHIAGTYDGRMMAMYINGVLTNSYPFAGTMSDNGIGVYIGERNTGGQHFGGTLDDVRLYDVALSQEEIQAIMTAQSAPPATMTITGPTSSPTYSTSTATLTTLAGNGSGSVVTWECATCTPTSGTATGTTSWTISPLDVANGDNLISVRAEDADGQIKTDEITVTLDVGTEVPLVSGGVVR